MEEHEKNAVHEHLRMVKSLMQLKTKQEASAVSLIASQSQYLYSLSPLEFLITDFQQKRDCNAEWRSPPFYTHPQGYKLCLVVYPNGVWRGKDTHDQFL